MSSGRSGRCGSSPAYGRSWPRSARAGRVSAQSFACLRCSFQIVNFLCVCVCVLRAAHLCVCCTYWPVCAACTGVVTTHGTAGDRSAADHHRAASLRLHSGLGGFHHGGHFLRLSSRFHGAPNRRLSFSAAAAAAAASSPAVASAVRCVHQQCVFVPPSALKALALRASCGSPPARQRRALPQHRAAPASSC